MLDFNCKENESFAVSSNDSLKDKIKSSIKNEMSAKNARRASFITLASVLSACNFGGSSDSVAPLTISAIKGPLSNALAFVDRDGDGVHDDGEEFAVTSSTGSATITPSSSVSASQKLVITSITAGQTIGGTTYTTGTVDTNTGGAVADLVLKAPSNSTVVTPVTTLVAETGLSESAVKEVLGLPAEMDVLNFNPFADNLSEADKAVALAAEKVALKVYTTVSTIQASAKSSGLDAAKAFATAIEAVGDVVKEQSAAGAKADLADSAIIDKVVTKTETVLTTKLQEAGFDATAVASAVNANKAVLATAKAQIKTVNEAADAITSFDATELGAIAKLAVKSGEEAAAAVTAEKAAPGSGAAKFTMKTAEAVATAKETAKKEVQESKGEETTTTTTASTAETKNFVLTDGTTVDWGLTAKAGASFSTIAKGSADNDASYTVSGNKMVLNLGQGFSLDTIKDMLNDKADLSFALSLASLPTQDDLSNTMSVTLTEGADSSVGSGEGQIKVSSKFGYEATSTSSTTFKHAVADPVVIEYTPRSGDADVTVNVTHDGDTQYAVNNDGNFGNAGEEAKLEFVANKFIGKLPDIYGTKNEIITKFVTSDLSKLHMAIDTTDLGLFNGSTKINTIETVLSIGDNPTTGGVVSGTARTGTTVSVTDIADLDGIPGAVTHQWQRSTDDGANWSNITGATSKSYTLQAADADLDGNGNLSDASQIRYTASYTDGQGKAYTGNDKFISYLTDANGTVVEVTANQAPGGTFAVSGGNHVGATLTANGSGITDADGIPTGGIKYHWEISTDNGSNWADISGQTASSSNTTYTIKAADVANKLTKIRAVAEFTDDQGADEVVNHSGTAKIAKPHIYLQKIGSSTSSKIEIGIFLDDELLTGTNQNKYKTSQIEITPVETWATNFDSVANGFSSSGDLVASYFHDGTGARFSNSTNFKQNQKIGSETITIWDTGSMDPKVSSLNAGDGKVKISPSFTASEVYNFTNEIGATKLAANDIQLASLFLDPNDTKQAAGNTVVEFNVAETNTFYAFWDGSANEITDDVSYLTDPYVFSFIL